MLRQAGSFVMDDNCWAESVWESWKADAVTHMKSAVEQEVSIGTNTLVVTSGSTAEHTLVVHDREFVAKSQKLENLIVVYGRLADMAFA